MCYCHLYLKLQCSKTDKRLYFLIPIKCSIFQKKKKRKKSLTQLVTFEQRLQGTKGNAMQISGLNLKRNINICSKNK